VRERLSGLQNERKEDEEERGPAGGRRERDNETGD